MFGIYFSRHVFVSTSITMMIEHLKETLVSIEML